MTSDLQKKVAEIFADFDMKLRLEQDNSSITDEMREVMEEVKRRDSPYSLKLDDPKYYVEFSITALVDGDPYEAEVWAKKALKLKKNCEGLIARGHALFKQRDYKGALGYYDEALDYCKKKSKVHEYRYRALKKRSMNERALKALKKALMEEERPELLGKYADTLVDLGEVKKAKKFYDRLEEVSGSRERRNKKVRSLLDEALNQWLPGEFDKIIKLDKTCKEAWVGKADRYWNLGQKQKAIECLKISQRYLKKGAVDKDLGDYEDRIPVIKECPECDGTGDCSTCGGSGDCVRCGGTGDCPACGGSGSCSTCGGTKKCPDCDGTGKSGWFKTCKTCGGTGECPDCDEFGTCQICDGTGNCQVCGGTENCGDCNGSGKCSRCDGTGMIKE